MSWLILQTLQILQSQGFDTVVVDSGEAALAALRDQDIAMMISDVRMPGISGLETLRRARQELGYARSAEQEQAEDHIVALGSSA